MAVPRVPAARGSRTRRVPAQRCAEGAADVDGHRRRRRRALGRPRSAGYVHLHAVCVRRRRRRKWCTDVAGPPHSGSCARSVRHRLVAGRTALRGGPADLRIRILRARCRAAPLRGAQPDRPVFRPRRQDRRARQARPAAAHARPRRAWLRCRTIRSAVQALAVPDRPQQPVRYRVRLSLRLARAADLRPGLRVRQLPRLLSAHGDRRRRSRLLRDRRSGNSRRRAPLRGTDRAHGARAALEPGLRQHRDGPRRRSGRAGAACAIRGGREAARHSAVGVSFRLRLHEHRQAALRVHVEPRQVSRAARGGEAVHRRRRARRGQPEAVPARRSSGVRRSGGAPRFRERPRHRCTVRRPVLGRRGRAGRFHASRRHPLVAAIARARGARLRYRRRVERQQRIRDLG